jgi:hypothetical protein
MNLLKEDLNLGDHIYVKRKLYSHHGIYAGDGNVIHYTGETKEKRNPSVSKTALEDFLKGGKLKRRHYKKRLPPSETLSLAKKHFADRSYSLTLNNCEHFATYCATGKKKSTQVRKAAAGFLGITLVVAGAVVQIRRIKKKMA